MSKNTFLMKNTKPYYSIKWLRIGKNLTQQLVLIIIIAIMANDREKTL